MWSATLWTFGKFYPFAYVNTLSNKHLFSGIFYDLGEYIYRIKS